MDSAGPKEDGDAHLALAGLKCCMLESDVWTCGAGIITEA